MTAFKVYYPAGVLENPYAIPASIKLVAYTLITSVEAVDPEMVFRRMNVVDGDPEYELPINLRCRSMSVGDVLIDQNGRALLCAAAGWTPVEVV